MAKPTEIPSWATDAGATNDPGATRKATGFVTGKKAPAKWFNWLHNRAAQWFLYLDALHNEPEFLNKKYSWTGDHGFARSVGAFNNVVFGPNSEPLYGDAAGVPGPRLRTVMLEPCGLNGWDPRAMQGAGAASQDPSRNSIGWGKIGLPVPYGGGLVRVRVGYERKAAGDDANLWVRKAMPAKTVPFGEYVSLELFELSTTCTGQQIVDLGPITDTLDTSVAVYSLEIGPSANRTQPLPDVVHWIEMQYLDPGPRNF
jgi:hypothetical protein